MTVSRKPSRKDLKKDDEFVTRGKEVVAWATQYSRQLIALGVGIVVVVVLGTVVSAANDRRATQAARALGATLEIAERPIAGDVEQPFDLPRDAFSSEQERREAFVAALEGVRDEHRRTVSAAVASLFLGKTAKEQGDLEAARAHYETFLKEAPRSHKMRFSALEAMAVIHELEEDLEAALVAYQRLAREGNEFYMPFALLQQARVLKALNRHDEARDLAQRVLDEHTDSGATRAARELLGRLPDEASDLGVAEATAG